MTRTNTSPIATLRTEELCLMEWEPAAQEERALRFIALSKKAVAGIRWKHFRH